MTREQLAEWVLEGIEEGALTDLEAAVVVANVTDYSLPPLCRNIATQSLLTRGN